MLGADLPDGDQVAYSHDQHGRRVLKQVNGLPEERYVWLDRTRLDRAVVQGVVLEFVYGAGRTPEAVVRDGRPYSLHCDQVGSLRVVADESGNVVKEVVYDAFGNILEDTNPAFRVPMGFAGGLFDPDTGFIRFGYRDYDPDTGRFTALDPIGLAGGDPDLYGYCLDDPINLVDPEGLQSGDPLLDELYSTEIAYKHQGNYYNKHDIIVTEDGAEAPPIDPVDVVAGVGGVVSTVGRKAIGAAAKGAAGLVRASRDWVMTNPDKVGAAGRVAEDIVGPMAPATKTGWAKFGYEWLKERKNGEK